MAYVNVGSRVCKEVKTATSILQVIYRYSVMSYVNQNTGSARVRNILQYALKLVCSDEFVTLSDMRH